MSSWIDLVSADGHRFRAYMAAPAEPAKAAVVILQEVFGVNQHIQAVTRGYAEAGYLAIAPALFDRIESGVELNYLPADVQRGLGLTRSLNWNDVMFDVQAAVNHGSRVGPVGVVGYCWGGTSAWIASHKVENLSASVCYYGGSIPLHVGLQPRTPVMLHWGEQDTIIAADKAREVHTAHPQTIEHFYPADHGFNCDQRASYHGPSAELAKVRTLAFLANHLSDEAAG